MRQAVKVLKTIPTMCFNAHALRGVAPREDLSYAGSRGATAEFTGWK